MGYGLNEISGNNPLPVDINMAAEGIATAAKQDTGNDSLASINNKFTTLNSVTETDASALNVRPYEFALLVAQGRIEGHSFVPKAGKKVNQSAGTGLSEDIWGLSGAYTGFPLTAEQAEVRSDNAGDTGTVTILVLESATSTSYTSVNVVLQGTTWVTLPVNVYRAHTMFYNNGTATSFNAGVITLRHKVTTTNIFLSMAVGTSQTYNCAYTVPFGSIGYFYDIEASLEDGATGTIEGAMWIRLNGQSPRLRRNFVCAQGANYQIDLHGILTVPALTDIQARVTYVSANNTNVIFSYNLLLVSI